MKPKINPLKKLQDEIKQLENELKRLEYEAWKLSPEVQSTTQNDLLLRLKEYAKSFNIPIYNSNEKSVSENSAGIIQYERLFYNNKFVPSSSEIVILNEFINEPWVLAHEIGHYIELLKTNQTTEDGADFYAGRICRSLLTAKEEDILEIPLRIRYAEVESKYGQKVA
jgi:hypothetical protein